LTSHQQRGERKRRRRKRRKSRRRGRKKQLAMPMPLLGTSMLRRGTKRKGRTPWRKTGGMEEEKARCEKEATKRAAREEEELHQEDAAARAQEIKEEKATF